MPAPWPTALLSWGPLLPEIEMADNAYKAAAGADLLIIVTEWNEFKLLNLERLKGLLKSPLIFDGRNIYDPMQLRQLGFTYYSVGRL